jgi:hypothetical protein
MLKFNAIFILILSCFCTLKGQTREQNEYESDQKEVQGKSRDLSGKAIKINLQYHKTLGEYSSLIGITPVYMSTNKRNNIHEIELHKLKTNQSRTTLYNQDQGEYYTMKKYATQIGLRYQHSISLIKNHHNKIVPQIGFSALTVYSVSGNKFPEKYKWDKKYSSIEEVFEVVPQLKYNRHKLFVDLGIPIDLLKVTFLSQNNDDVNSVDHGKNNSVDADLHFFKNFKMRLGLGIRM